MKLETHNRIKPRIKTPIARKRWSMPTSLKIEDAPRLIDCIIKLICLQSAKAKKMYIKATEMIMNLAIPVAVMPLNMFNNEILFKFMFVFSYKCMSL